MSKAVSGVTKRSGFTLVELMIVIAIVAILVSIALPNYQESVRKARRADAQTDLLEFSNTAERVFTVTNSYATTALPANSDFYVYSFPLAITATTYSIRATPTTAQSADACGAMSMNQAGQRSKTGSLAGCW